MKTWQTITNSLKMYNINYANLFSIMIFSRHLPNSFGFRNLYKDMMNLAAKNANIQLKCQGTSTIGKTQYIGILSWN